MKKKETGNRLIIIVIVLLLMATAIVATIRNKQKVEAGTKVQNETSPNIVEENIAKESEVVENKIKDIDFLANVKEPKYYKNEKNIKIPVIIYHAFGEVPKSDANYALFSTEERFDDNVKTLLDAGYTFINLEEVYKYNNGELALPEKVCVITMDDGWAGCYTEAYKVLKKYNVPATIFIVNYFMNANGYLTWDQAKEMFDSGLVKIHIHGLWHNDCTTLSESTLKEQYNTAHEEIENKMGASIQRIMAYPAGSHNDNTIKWLKEIGYDVQVLTKYGTVNKSRTLDMTDIGRIRGEMATGRQLLNVITAAEV